MVDTRPGSEWFWQTDKYGTPAHKPIVEPWKVIAEPAGFLIAWLGARQRCFQRGIYQWCYCG